MSCMTDTELLKVEAGEDLTHNVQPLLHEIRHALHELLRSRERTVIDLRSLPLAPGEEDKLLGELGRGEVQARLSALGPSEIIETRFPGVWVVTHHNNNDEIIGKFIEVCDVPGLLRSPQEDIQRGLEQLQAQLGEVTT